MEKSSKETCKIEFSIDVPLTQYSSSNSELKIVEDADGNGIRIKQDYKEIHIPDKFLNAFNQIWAIVNQQYRINTFDQYDAGLFNGYIGPDNIMRHELRERAEKHAAVKQAIAEANTPPSADNSLRHVDEEETATYQDKVDTSNYDY